MEKKESLLFQVTITGLGGQGALLFGQLLAEAGATRFKNVSFFPQYATVMRGGESECTVTLSEEEIDSPLVFEPQTAVVMAAPQLKQFEKRVVSGGMIFIDSSVITEKIERRLRRKKVREVASRQIGKIVLTELRRMDTVAYLRFASVYLEFADFSDFQKAIK